MTQTYGEISIRFTSGRSAGQLLSVRGKVEIEAAGGAIETVTNQDSTIVRTFKPGAVMAKLSFDRGLPKWDRNMLLDSFDVTIVEEQAPRTHYLTDAHFDGKPSQDLQSGEVTGLSIACASANYRCV